MEKVNSDNKKLNKGLTSEQKETYFANALLAFLFVAIVTRNDFVFKAIDTVTAWFG